MQRNSIGSTVIFYPFFIAKKSGTLLISSEDIVVEATKADLWNLVNDNIINTGFKVDINGIRNTYTGDADFLSKEEIDTLLKYVPALRRKFRDVLNEGESLLLEWSFAQNCTVNKEPCGKPYLMFYELRSVR